MIDIRVGTGIDFHRLIEDESRPFILGGYSLPDESLALKGHSDADIVLHALADAVYGAVARGDIGYHFPDTDESNKGMDSRIIMKAAIREITGLGFYISNVDITIMGERPKINPHRDSIRKSLSKIIGIDTSRISVKATTTEKMGAIGRQEGLACMASVLLIKS